MGTNPGIIIQARLTSSRFPNKNLCPLLGKPIIDWVIEACQKTKFPLAIAIPDELSNRGLTAYIDAKYNKKIRVLSGHPQDLIARFQTVNRTLGFDPIIRICSDNPFLAPDDIDLAVELYNKREYYTRINHVEVFSIDELHWAERFDPHVKRREDCVNICSFSVDYPTDIETFENAWESNTSPTLKGLKKLLDV